MSKIALITDIHLRGKDFQLKKETVKNTVKKCLEEKVDLILNLGDTFDKGDVGDKSISSEKIISFLEDIFNIDIPMIWIEGNHDQYGNTGSGLDYLHFNNLVKVKDKCDFFSFKDFDLACIPWIRSNKDYYKENIEFLDSLPCREGVPRIIIGHLVIVGCSLGKYGYTTPDHYYSHGLTDLLNSKFKPTHQWYGHIHEKINLGHGAYYLGAMSQLRFGEAGGFNSGFHIFDTETGHLEFYSIDAPKYYSIDEKDLHKYDTVNNYVRFYTEFPEKYKHLRPNVKAIYRLEKQEQTITSINTDEFNVNNLVNKYCDLLKINEPTSEFYKQRKNRLSVGLAKSVTGLDRINHIFLKNVGTHKELKVSFKKGLTAIIGPNGSGKTTLIESLPGALFSYFPSRSHVKNYMDKGSKLEVNLDALGKNYVVKNEVANHRFISKVNDVEYTLAKQFQEETERIFGDKNTFGKLIFMDQTNTYDLVTAKDSARLKLLRDLFDLTSFDDNYKFFEKELEEKETQITNLEKIKIELQQLNSDYNSIEVEEPKPLEDTFPLEKELNNLLAKRALFEKNIIAVKELEEIKKFEAQYNIEEIVQAEKELVEAKEAEKWKDVGCKNNPLPCIYIKNLKFKEYNIEEIKNKIPPNYKDYVYLKNKHKKVNSELNNITEISLTDITSLQNKINEIKTSNALIISNNKLIKVKETLLNKIKVKEQEVEKYPSLNTLEAEIRDLNFLCQLCGKKGLSLYIINLIKNELQIIIDELITLSELDIVVTLSTGTELDILQILFGKEKYDIFDASGGEKSLVRILFKLALMIYLNKYFGTYKVLVLDEPTAALDDNATDVVISILKRLRTKFNQIIIVTHSDKIANSCDNRIEL